MLTWAAATIAGMCGHDDSDVPSLESFLPEMARLRLLVAIDPQLRRRAQLVY